ncbi:MAG: hypothetical protein JWM89_1841 [Acidimicrobiales bacterium]|nr:hypothetical protein [Acidimicrobiales bacterium]
MPGDDADVLLREVNRAVEEAGLTQKVLAAELGVDQGRVSLLLRGARGAVLSAQQLIEIERIAGLEPGEINRRVIVHHTSAESLSKLIAQGDYATAALDGRDPTDAERGPAVNRPSPAGGQDDNELGA